MELRRHSDFVQHRMTMAYPSGYATYPNFDSDNKSKMTNEEEREIVHHNIEYIKT